MKVKRFDQDQVLEVAIWVRSGPVVSCLSLFSMTLFMALERYLAAAPRSNNRLGYAQAPRHFEQHWGGLLPAAPAAIAEYPVLYAGSRANNTLQRRLAALGQWYTRQGFADPTKGLQVRQSLNGTRPALYHHDVPFRA